MNLALQSRRAPYAARLANPGKQLYPPPVHPRDARHVFQGLADPAPSATTAQLYIHLPFCATLCSFCPIFKEEVPRSSVVEEYTASIVREIQTLATTRRVRSLQVNSIYIGGGTPSVFPTPLLERILDAVFACMHVIGDPQVTFEGHVKSLTRRKMQDAISLGCNRVSTGVQTFDERLRAALNLTPGVDEIERWIRTAREVGFEHVNVDLMYNIPGQTTHGWTSDLRRTIALDPTGVDAYETVIARSTPLYELVERGTLRVEKSLSNLADRYTIAEEVLGEAGYIQRNMFTWDKPGYNNVVLGHASRLRDGQSEIIGVGMAAYSQFGGRSFMNAVVRPEYVAKVTQCGIGVATGSDCSDRTLRERYVIMSLTDFAIDRDEYARRFSASIETDFGMELDRFAAAGLLAHDDGAYSLTPRGRPWATTMSVELYGLDVLEGLMRERILGCDIVPVTYEEVYEFPVFAVFHPEAFLDRWRDFGLLKHYISMIRRESPRWLASVLQLAASRALQYRRVPPLSLLKVARGLLG